MPLPPTVSRFSEIQTGFTFLLPTHTGGPGQRTVKWVLLLDSDYAFYWFARELTKTKLLARISSAELPEATLVMEVVADATYAAAYANFTAR